MKPMLHFHGEFRKRLDSGNRLVIPARFLKSLGDNPKLTCYVHIKESCIRFYELREFDDMIAEILYKPSDVDYTAIKRYVYNYSYYVKPDSRNRVVIPRKLLEKAGIHDEVVIIGLGSRFEVWDMNTYMEILSPIDGIEILEMPL